MKRFSWDLRSEATRLKDAGRCVCPRCGSMLAFVEEDITLRPINSNGTIGQLDVFTYRPSVRCTGCKEHFAFNKKGNFIQVYDTTPEEAAFDSIHRSIREARRNITEALESPLYAKGYN